MQKEYLATLVTVANKIDEGKYIRHEISHVLEKQYMHVQEFSRESLFAFFDAKMQCLYLT